MARTVHLSLTGETEKFIDELEKIGIDEKSAIAKGLWLLKIAHETGRVGLLKQDFRVLLSENKIVDQVFCLRLSDKLHNLEKESNRQTNDIMHEITKVRRKLLLPDEDVNRSTEVKEEQ